ncbi:MAG: hypothetical protein QOF17_1277, partial [Solirubrobacteraceae bacterium]|nr:hypothetical protein [Solirubrobacteraceae bacterium]
VLHEQAEALALAVVAIQAMLDPSLIVLGGGIGSRADVLGAVRGDLNRLTTRPIALVSSRLGNRAGVVGAAQAALQHAAAESGDTALRTPEG